MIKLAVVEDRELPPSIKFYRTVGPISLLERRFQGVLDVTYMTKDAFLSNELTPLKFDLVFVERAINTISMQILMHAKQCGCLTWVDFDDDLFNIPHYNKAKNYYANEQVMKTVQQCISISDIVSVSTDALKESFQGYAINEVKVFKNAWDNFRFPMPPIVKSNPNQSIKMCWRGGGKHEGDLYKVRLALSSAIKDSNFNWRFFGYQPWFLNVSDEQYVQWSGLFAYFKRLFTSAPDFMIVPLALNKFNKGKSNCSWLEATISGAACIAPKGLPEFAYNGAIIHYEGNKQLENIFAKIKSGKLTKDKYVKKSRSILETNYKLSDINALRAKHLMEIFNVQSKETTELRESNDAKTAHIL